MSPDSVMNFAKTLRNNETASQTYLWNQDRRYEPAPPATCDADCRYSLFCEITSTDYFGTQTCIIKGKNKQTSNKGGLWWSSGLERRPITARVRGSNPAASDFRGNIRKNLTAIFFQWTKRSGGISREKQRPILTQTFSGGISREKQRPISKRRKSSFREGKKDGDE